MAALRAEARALQSPRESYVTSSGSRRSPTESVRKVLRTSPDLKKSEWRNHAHLEQGRFDSLLVKHEGVSHWFLRDKTTGEVPDPTAEQFSTPVPYERGRRCAFLTKTLSKRARELIKRLGL